MHREPSSLLILSQIWTIAFICLIVKGHKEGILEVLESNSLFSLEKKTPN
jgi:hypothetical protein